MLRRVSSNIYNGSRDWPTSGDAMHLVPDEEKYQGHERAEEGAGNDLAIPDGSRVGRAQGDTAESPRESRDNV